jgi:hypothetical protein
MSAPGANCVICGKPALDISGWDGGFPSYREFRALWDPPRVFQDMVHFTCLRGWEHRAAMLTELVDLATDAVLEFDVEVGGQTHRITRAGLGYTGREFATNEILVLRHEVGAEWLVVDFTGAWQFVHGRYLLPLVRGESVRVQGGRGKYGLTLTPPPTEADLRSWGLADLLEHAGVKSRYPGLTAGDADLRIFDYNSETGWFEYSVHHPLTIHPDALEYFRGEYRREGETAFLAESENTG